MGQFLVNEELPEDMRDYNRVLDKKGLSNLLREVAEKHPDQYRKVSHGLSQIGHRVSFLQGGYSFGLRHMRKALAAKDIGLQIRQKVKKILANDNLSDEARNAAIIKAVGPYMKEQQDRIYDEAWAERNPLALQIASGTRGNKMNLASLLGSDLLYTDHHDNVIPIPVLRSYAQGLTPAEYWAGTYGARKGVMATKFATQDAGFLSKQLNQIAHRLMVTAQDDDEEPLTVRGLPVDTDDEDNEGAYLAQPVGPYKRNTLLTPKVLRDLKRRGHGRILVRSPIVGGARDGGLLARDVGIREEGNLPGRGTNVGLTAAQALSEPLSQSQLSAKHSGGVAGEEKALSGFDLINQLIQVPKKFKGGAAHAQVDGRVQNIQAASAGGHYVTVNGERHYVGPDYSLKVKRGDVVEAGDVLSEGAPNPAEIVKHKGVGEGKRYFVKAYRDAYRDAGLKSNRRNIELLARGLINHVRLTEEMHDFVPDDVVSYSALERNWEPRPETQALDPKRAIGRYLERPYLHYSIGTRVRPSVVKELNDFGITAIDTHSEPPPFEPEMIRGMASMQHDPDWQTRLYGSNQQKSLLSGVHRGASSTDQGTSFVPGLAKAVDFGRTGLVRTPEKGEQDEQTRPVSQGLNSQTTTNPTALDGKIKFSVDNDFLQNDQVKRPRQPADANFTGRQGATSGTQPKPAPTSAADDSGSAWLGEVVEPAPNSDYNLRVRPGYRGSKSLMSSPFAQMPGAMQQQFVRGVGNPAIGIGMLAGPNHLANILRGPQGQAAGTQQAQQPWMTPEQFRSGLQAQGFTPGSGNLQPQQQLSAEDGFFTSMAKDWVANPAMWGRSGAGALAGQHGGRGLAGLVGRMMPSVMSNTAAPWMQRAVTQMNPVRSGVARALGRQVPGMAGRQTLQTVAQRGAGQAGGVLGATGMLDAADAIGALPEWAGGTGMGNVGVNTDQTWKDLEGGLLDKYNLGARPWTAVAAGREAANETEQIANQVGQRGTTQRAPTTDESARRIHAQERHKGYVYEQQPDGTYERFNVLQMTPEQQAQHGVTQDELRLMRQNQEAQAVRSQRKLQEAEAQNQALQKNWSEHLADRFQQGGWTVSPLMWGVSQLSR